MKHVRSLTVEKRPKYIVCESKWNADPAYKERVKAIGGSVEPDRKILTYGGKPQRCASSPPANPK